MGRTARMGAKVDRARAEAPRYGERRGGTWAPTRYFATVKGTEYAVFSQEIFKMPPPVAASLAMAMVS